MCWRVLVCMHVFAVWLYKPEESRELSKVVALVSSARGLCRRWNQPDCTGGRKKKKIKNHDRTRWKSSNPPPKSRKCLCFSWLHLFIAAQATLYSFTTFEEEKSMRGYPPTSKLSSARQFVYRAPAWPLPVIWCTLHILHAASLGFSKWISEAWAATFLALCTRCTLSWAAESPNTCWAWATAIQMASRARREEREGNAGESGCWQQNQLIEWVDNSYADWVALRW